MHKNRFGDYTKEQLLSEIESAVDRYAALQRCASLPTRDLKLTRRIVQRLEHYGIGTICELAAHSRADLKQMSGLGAVAIYDIDRALSSYGFDRSHSSKPRK